jgi:hypothetical protein
MFFCMYMHTCAHAMYSMKQLVKPNTIYISPNMKNMLICLIVCMIGYCMEFSNHNQQSDLHIWK